MCDVVDRVTKNRLKLTKGCLIEVFRNQRWQQSYITESSDSETQRIDFTVYDPEKNVEKNKNEPLRYSRWSRDIRCHEKLLSLSKSSDLLVYNKNMGRYWCAKIVEIFDYDEPQLDIFKVIYKTDQNQYFYKYIHQFSANILSLANNDQRPSDYTELEVAIHSNHSSPLIKHDIMDAHYAQLLLQVTSFYLIFRHILYTNYLFVYLFILLIFRAG